MILAGIFIYWGISSLIPWGFWFWWGFIALGIGASILLGQIYALTNRSKLRNVVKHEISQNPNATVEDIVSNTSISHKDVKDIILDLKASGELTGKFSTKTGALKYTTVAGTTPTQEKVPEEKGKFCPSCGTTVSKDTAAFCAFCGSKL